MIPIRMTLIRAPWNLIPFVLSMFVIVLSLKEQGFTQQFFLFLSKFDDIYAYGISGSVIANLINNIPMSVFFCDLLENAAPISIYAVIIASNISAFITPIGALAGIMWMSLLKAYDIHYSVKQFLWNGLIIGIPALGVALSLLLVF